MTDLFLVLIQPGEDELQGIKKHLEVADFIVINKADGDAERLATAGSQLQKCYDT